MHREEQILQAAAALVAAWPSLGAEVHKHRTLTLSADDQELPAISVNNGDDDPLGERGVTNLAFIDSVTQLKFTLCAQGRDQEEVAAELDRMRVVLHKAMMQSPQTLGLSFVMQIGYGGASEPEYSSEGSPLVGKRECAFSVMYRMNLTDPE
jgi:hypothetical protein